MQEVSLNMLKIKLQRYPHLNELENFLKKIDKQYLKLILLYGSLAKGRFTQYSDIDVLCVFNYNFTNMKERFMMSYKFSEGLVQPKNITLKELKNGLLRGDSFLHSIFEYGLLLYNTIPNEKLEQWIQEGKSKWNMELYPPS